METFLIIFVSYGNYTTFAPNSQKGLKATSMEAKKQKILESAGKLILKYGIKSMTMDDIARELGISKKTLYLYVEDKNDLIKQVIELDMKLDHAQICSIVASFRSLNFYRIS